MSGRIIVVSNRLAIVREGETPVGGLAVAVYAALKDRGGIWFGWSGQTVPTTASLHPHVVREGNIDFVSIDLTRRDHAEFYAGFSNGVLWPLFHYRPGLLDYKRRDYEGYLRVNDQFARALMTMLRPDDTIWVHDYHLMPLARSLRQLGARQRIGFFLHTPLAARQLLVTIPSHRNLMSAMADYDLIGFQTEDDRTCFVDYLAEEQGATRLGSGRLRLAGATCATGVFPIGIDTAEVAREARERDTSSVQRRLLRALRGRALIVGVDRLDYSKGLVERFRAYERLLERFSRLRDKVILMQIAPPSREGVEGYREIRRELDIAAGNINGRFGEYDWVPIRYINRSYVSHELVSFYRTARVGLVTPLRDGMNLVAKEYLAAQNPEDPGVLVLSCFAGAARELRSALIVNPYDTDEVAEAMESALRMSREERMARWRDAMDVLEANDVHAWRRRYLAALSEVAAPAA